MKVKHITLAALILTPAAFAADKEPMGGKPMDHQGMNMEMDQKVAGQTATATGTVKKVNMEKGTVTIAHGPVESLGWPSMTMGFKAEPDQLKTLKEGDEIEFEFSSKGMDSTITRIEKQ